MRNIILFILIVVFIVVARENYLTNIKYHKYSSRDPELNITIYYPREWHYSEHRASYGNYSQVDFYESDRPDKDFRARMVVNVKKGLGNETIDTLANDLISERMKFKEAIMISKLNTKLLDKDVIEVKLAYKTLSKLYRVDVKLIPVKERIVVFKEGDRFYTLSYENTEGEFERFNRNFTYCMRTLKSKNKDIDSDRTVLYNR